MALVTAKHTEVVKLYYESYSPFTVNRSMQNLRIRNLVICKYKVIDRRQTW